MNRKDVVKAAFSAAAHSYDGAARAQGIAAEHLSGRVADLGLPAAPKVLEFGCGTGMLTRFLRPMIGGDWLLTDIAPAMVQTAQAAFPDVESRVMDAERPDLGEQRFDLIVSNMAAQWFGDLAGAVQRLQNCLTPGGKLAFSTLGDQTFRQWRAAHDALGLSCGIPIFPQADDLRVSLPKVRVHEQIFDLAYDDCPAFIRELRQIGAQTAAPDHRPLAPGSLRRVFQRLGAPVAMTYHVLHVITAAE